MKSTQIKNFCQLITFYYFILKKGISSQSRLAIGVIRWESRKHYQLKYSLNVNTPQYLQNCNVSYEAQKLKKSSQLSINFLTKLWFVQIKRRSVKQSLTEQLHGQEASVLRKKFLYCKNTSVKKLDWRETACCVGRERLHQRSTACPPVALLQWDPHPQHLA